MHLRRSRVAVARLLGALTLTAVLVAGAGPASAERRPLAVAGGTTTTTAPAAPDIIPEPNSGQTPEDAGDRGGSLQILVLVVILGGIACIGFLAVRESRRSRAERGS